MTDRSVVVRLKAEVASYVAGMERARTATSQFGREITGQGKAVRADIEQVGRGAALMAGGMAVALGASAKAAMDWESAWAGVTKTVDGSAAQMADLEGGLRKLARELPATHGEIAAVAEAAGQLGIQRGAIIGFTKTMVDLGETTNLTADQAATSMARMANIMGTAQTDIGRMASTLVALGNAGASTESEILDMAMRIAGAAKQVGISEAATLGFANALSSVGVEAEAGGTAISRVFSTIATSVAEGGEELEGFARVAGMSGADFKRAFQEDAATATIAFIEGLDRIKGSGENVFAVLQDLELGDIRVRDALLRASSAGDLFRESLALGADEWERNNALQTEAEKRYDTTAAKLAVARNNVTDLAIDLGGALLPALAKAAEGASNLARGFGELPDPIKGAGVALGAVTTAGLGLVGAVGILGPKLEAFQTALGKMGAGGAMVSRNLATIGMTLGAVGGLITAYSVALGQQARKQAEAEEAANRYTEAIKEQGTAIGDLTEQTAAEAILTGDLGRALRDTGTDVSLMVEAIHEHGSALDEMDNKWDRYQEGAFAVQAATSGLSQDTWALTRVLNEAGVAGTEFADQLLGLWSSGKLTREEMSQLLDIIGDQGAGYETGAIEAANHAEATDQVGEAADQARPKLGSLAAELGLNAEEAKQAREEFEDLLDAYRGAVDPLFAMVDALRSNREAMAKEGEIRAEKMEAVADAADALSAAERDLAEARSTSAAARAEAIADAEERLARARSEGTASEIASAEKALQKARERGDPKGIAAAEERVIDARERLTEAQSEAVITEAELAEINQDVAETALDVEVASRELAAAVAEGTVSVDNARAMLAEWVTQGLITEAQAANVAEQFGIAAGKADEFAGDYVANVYVNSAAAEAALDRLLEKAIGVLNAKIALDPYSADVAQAEKFVVRATAALHRAAGGPITAAGGFPGGPRGTDTVPVWATPGEYMMQKSAVDRFGVGFMDAINQGLTPASGWGGGTIDQSRHVHLDAPITVADARDRRAAGDIYHHLRKLSIVGSVS